MLIPNKFNGYSRDGIRLYHFGGGGRGGGGPNPPNPNSWEAEMANRNRAAGVGTMGGVNARDGYVDPNAPSAAPVNVHAAQPAAVVLTPEQRQANIERDLALSQVRGARPSGQDSQFYQPAYQPQYTNYTTTNPLGVSQYGTPMTARSLVDSAYAGIGRYGSGNEINQVDPGGRQYWESRLASGSLNPQSLFDQFNGVINQARQDPSNPYNQYVLNQPGYGGGYQGYMPPMQTPFSYQQPMQQPMQQAQRTSSGPSQAIVGRSSQMRGTPSVMRRAEGGIASLLDNDE